MRDEMVYALLRCKRPKWWVLARAMRGREWQEDDVLYRPEEVRECKVVCHGDWRRLQAQAGSAPTPTPMTAAVPAAADAGGGAAGAALL